MRGLLLVLAWIWVAVLPAAAQRLVVQPTPATAWLDLRPAQEGAAPQAVPPWVTGLDVYAVTQIDGSEGTLISIGLDPAQSAIVPGVLVRLVFADLPGQRPTIAGVDAEGNVVSRSPELGEGLGLLTSESFDVGPGVAGIQIEVPGDGSNVTTAFLSLLDKDTLLRAADAHGPGARPMELFHRTLMPRYGEEDLYLFGRVRAVLSREVTSMEPGDVYAEVDLDDQPLLAVLRFRVSGAEVTRPILVSVNGGEPLPAAYRLPDLADPAYLGLIRGQEPGMTFRYADWIEAEVAVPGVLLLGGRTNEFLFMLPQGHGTAAIRDVVLELKFNWDKLNYDIQP